VTHDVFISYSSKDNPAADATCAVQESKDMRCWIAPRDMSRVLVLVFSANANLSRTAKPRRRMSFEESRSRTVDRYAG
jgi:hypothetical protein